MDSFHIDGTVSEKLMFSRYANYGSYGSDEPDRSYPGLRRRHGGGIVSQRHCKTPVGLRTQFLLDRNCVFVVAAATHGKRFSA